MTAQEHYIELLDNDGKNSTAQKPTKVREELVKISERLSSEYDEQKYEVRTSGAFTYLERFAK